MNTTIELNNVRIYAHHGCLQEEGLIGSEYSVHLSLETKSLEKAFNSDKLEDTVDYVHLNRIIKEEMAIRSKLLEHVGARIIKRIFKEINLSVSAEVTICKLNPPIGGDVESVCVRIYNKRF